MSKGKILFKDDGMDKEGNKTLLKITGNVRTLHSEEPDMDVELVDVHFSKKEYSAVQNMIKGLMEILAVATKREDDIQNQKDIDRYNNGLEKIL